ARAALSDDRADITLHALAQISDQLFVEHELSIRVRDLVGRQRSETLGRRHVGTRRERAKPALLFFGKEPAEIKSRGVRMRRLLEDAAGQREHRRLVHFRERDFDLTGALEWPGAGGGIEGSGVGAFGDAA